MILFAPSDEGAVMQSMAEVENKDKSTNLECIGYDSVF